MCVFFCGSARPVSCRNKTRLDALPDQLGSELSFAVHAALCMLQGPAAPFLSRATVRSGASCARDV